jgi:hypothetical protein
MNEDGSYTDGVFPQTLRSIATDTENEHWINLASRDLNAVKAERLNSVLDDNKCLILDTGERVSLPANARVVCQTSTFDVTSPATVSRLGITVVEA